VVPVRRLITDSREMTRRSFLALVGWGAFVAASAIALLESFRPPFKYGGLGGFLYPNALYTAPPLFKAGLVSDYPVGSTTVLTDKRVVINRDSDGIYAFDLICTHLGCTPDWFTDVTSDLVGEGVQGIKDPLTGQAATTSNPALPGFKCPCHGSRYFRDSINFYGPAPRPMDHIKVGLAPDGHLLVDRGSFVDLRFRLKV